MAHQVTLSFVDSSPDFEINISVSFKHFDRPQKQIVIFHTYGMISTEMIFFLGRFCAADTYTSTEKRMKTLARDANCQKIVKHRKAT